MTDQEFLSQFEDCTLPKELFKHHSHLRLAWLYLQRYSAEEASVKIHQGIIRYATSIGAQAIYHETLTQLWIRLVQGAMAGEGSFDEFMGKHPELINKDLPKEYYSAGCLDSEAARKGWIAPDLKPLA